MFWKVTSESSREFLDVHLDSNTLHRFRLMRAFGLLFAIDFVVPVFSFVVHPLSCRYH